MAKRYSFLALGSLGCVGTDAAMPDRVGVSYGRGVIAANTRDFDTESAEVSLEWDIPQPVPEPTFSEAQMEFLAHRSAESVGAAETVETPDSAGVAAWVASNQFLVLGALTLALIGGAVPVLSKRFGKKDSDSDG